MRRKMDLIRLILEVLADSAQTRLGPAEIIAGVRDIDPKTETSVISYHLCLCVQAGFVSKSTKANVTEIVYTMTWCGHERLDKFKAS